MRIHVAHETRYRYDVPAKSAVQLMRLTPRNHNGQYVARWSIEIGSDCRLDPHEDAFGNIAHSFTIDGPISELVVRVDGVVETQDTNGVIAGTLERFPPALYLRETQLTKADPAIIAYAEAARGSTLDALHALQGSIYRDFAFDPDPTHTGTSAVEAFALKRGVCQDYAHVFIAAARQLNIPSRYVSGYFRRADGAVFQEAGHAWVEAFVSDLGWVAFDPANGICATEAHVRVAVGLDYQGAAPIRGARYGGGGETLGVTVHVDQAGRQA